MTAPGWMFAMTGAVPAIVNGSAFDVAPWVTTVTDALPAAATSDAGTGAVTSLSLTNVVASGLPFQFTTESEPSSVPVTVSVNPPLPATTTDGPSASSTGFAVTTLKEIPFVAVPEMETVMVAVVA